MEWRGEGILLTLRRHGESAAIAEVLTATHGRHAGLIHGGAGRRLAPTLQPGNRLSLHWRGRLPEHLGSFSAELLEANAPRAMADREGLAILDSFRALAVALLPERVPSPAMYEATLALLGVVDDPTQRRGIYVRWEIGLLGELGFALDLTRCAATGRTDDLAYVSPRSGRAVERKAGAPYADRLLPFPAFVTGDGPVEADAFAEALRMTGHFLARWAGQPLGMHKLPAARERLQDLRTIAAGTS